MLVYPGMTLLDLVGPLQVWAMWPGAEFQFVWKETGLVRTDAGIAVAATERFDSAWDAPDVLFAPGGLAGTFKLLGDAETISFLAERGGKAAWVTSVCTGAHLLGAAGLLNGYAAATHWIALDELAVFGAVPSADRYVIDRNRATGGGVTAGIDFALALTAHALGEPVARNIQLALQYAPEPPFDSGTPDGAGAPAVSAVRERFGGDRMAALIRTSCAQAAQRLSRIGVT